MANTDSSNIPGDQVPSVEFSDLLISLCPDGIIGVDQKGLVVFYNQAAEDLIGIPAKDVLGKAFITEIYDPPEIAGLVKKKLMTDDHGPKGVVHRLKLEVVTKQKGVTPIELSGFILYQDGAEMGSVGFFHDLTYRNLAISDALTGLFNRRYLDTILPEEIKRAKRNKRPLSLIYLDLDNFKPFNDRFGHATGDEILKMAADCLRLSKRSYDYAFRLGGDEFALLLTEADEAVGRTAARRVKDNLARLWGERFSDLDPRLASVSFSIGIAGMVDDDAKTLINRADQAMYQAKKQGKDRFALA